MSSRSQIAFADNQCAYYCNANNGLKRLFLTLPTIVSGKMLKYIVLLRLSLLFLVWSILNKFFSIMCYNNFEQEKNLRVSNETKTSVNLSANTIIREWFSWFFNFRSCKKSIGNANSFPQKPEFGNALDIIFCIVTGPGFTESFLVLIMNYSEGYLMKVKLYFNGFYGIWSFLNFFLDRSKCAIKLVTDKLSILCHVNINLIMQKIHYYEGFPTLVLFQFLSAFRCLLFPVELI